ncbi:Myosin-10 [Diplonema papillatum]|nr:Myosin-10 [Diplonema papillatum]
MARAGQFDVGALCFFEDDDHSWLLGKVLRKSDDGKAASVVPVDDDGNELDDSQPRDNLALTQLAPVADGSLDAVKDLIDMPYLHEAVLLYHIRKRYWADFVYSNIGPIVLAVNPYNFNIAHYSDERMDQYIEEKQSALSSGSQQITHLWSVAHEAYWLMKTTDRPQSILVSGESGAGKTEAAKIVAHYLARCSTHFSEPEMREAALKITKRVVATSPVLEAFGNAKTARNDNSSRFGKFMKLKFNASGTLMGTFTKHYLLEKSRIITHGDLERCFHTYYQITAGASPEDRERYQLDNPRIRWIYEGYEPSEEELASDKQAYHEVREAMDVVGLTPEEQRQVYDVIAGILHFQGVQIAGEEAAELGDDGKACIGLVAGLWGVSAEELEKDILTTSTVLRGEVIVKQLTLKQAIEMRDGLSKALYERLFSWLIAKINEVLDVPDLNPGAEEHWIGLLDIFGFENFTANSLEQFLINLANEQLQNHYNACVFARDLALYEKEGIDSTTLEPPDNSHTLDLLKGKGSIIDHLNDACRTQSANDGTFLSTINDNFGPRLGDKSHVPHQSYVKKKIDDGSYGVKHYASDVWYNVDGFKLKNLDTLKDAFKVLMRTSSKPLIAGLLPEPEDAAPKGKAALRTTATRFRLSLDELLQLIDQTEPHWIRCVKPHSSKKARRFHGAEVMNQLRCAGVLETVKIRQNGYSMRVDHEQFWKRFCIVLDKPSAFETLDGCRELLARVSPAGTKNGQVGRTKIFLKDVPYKALEKQRDDALAASGVLVQAFARARVCLTFFF